MMKVLSNIEIYSLHPLKPLCMAVLSLFCTMALHAQKVTVSEEVTLRNDLSYDLVGKIDSHFVLFRDRGNK